MNDISWIIPYRTEALTSFFAFFRVFASESFILFSVALGYWVVQRRFFRDLAVLICLCVLLNLWLKVAFQIPRPNVAYLVPVDKATLYGFPSGDVQIAVVYWLSLAAFFMRPALSFIAIGVILGTACSRIYLGVHSPLDVAGGFVFGGLLFFLFWHYRERIRFHHWARVVLYVTAGGLYFWGTPPSIDSMSVPVLGLLGGVTLGSYLITRFPCCSISSNTQLSLLVLWGVATLIALRVCLKVVMGDLGGDPLLAAYITYFLLGFHIVWGGPYSFGVLLRVFTKKPQENLVAEEMER